MKRPTALSKVPSTHHGENVRVLITATGMVVAAIIGAIVRYHLDRPQFVGLSREIGRLEYRILRIPKPDMVKRHNKPAGKPTEVPPKAEAARTQNSDETSKDVTLRNLDLHRR